MWSLGIIIFELCQKRLPFCDKKVASLRTNINEPINIEPIPDFYSKVLANTVG